MSERELEPRFTRAHAALSTLAVTGTNGKTTTTSMIASIVRAAGEPDARMTTIGAFLGDERIEPAGPPLLALVERAIERGVRTLALEVTSLALARDFATRWPPHVAVLTNLTRDHLDVHGSPEAYLASKARLFRALPPGGVAVLPADDEAGELIAEVLPDGVRCLRFALDWQSPADLAAERIEVSAGGTRIVLTPSPLAAAMGGSLSLGVIGRVHAANALAAALATSAVGFAPEAIVRGLGAFSGVPGRFEIVRGASGVMNRATIVVDYAHTPDGLARTLETARAIARGRVIVVFGCGGERDRGKRPLMGAIAHAHADRVVLTSDNPRREPAAQIAAEVQRGAAGEGASWIVELDRRAAIARALDEAREDDVVVIAGRGHETHQEIGGERVPFVDREVVLSLWR